MAAHIADGCGAHEDGWHARVAEQRLDVQRLADEGPVATALHVAQLRALMRLHHRPKHT